MLSWKCLENVSFVDKFVEMSAPNTSNWHATPKGLEKTHTVKYCNTLPRTATHCNTHLVPISQMDICHTRKESVNSLWSPHKCRDHRKLGKRATYDRALLRKTTYALSGSIPQSYPCVTSTCNTPQPCASTDILRRSHVIHIQICDTSVWQDSFLI